MRVVRGHSRLCCLMRYFPERKLIVVEGVAVGPAYASDTRLGQEALAQLEGSGPLLADAGFDGGEVWARVEEKGLEPHIPLKGGGRYGMSEGRRRSESSPRPFTGCGPKEYSGH